MHAGLQAGGAVVLDLASWEIVQRFHIELWAIVASGAVHTLTGNEDEWLTLAQHVLSPSEAQAGGCAVQNESSGMWTLQLLLFAASIATRAALMLFLVWLAEAVRSSWIAGSCVRVRTVTVCQTAGMQKFRWRFSLVQLRKYVQLRSQPAREPVATASLRAHQTALDTVLRIRSAVD